jgi:hypothetical protein
VATRTARRAGATAKVRHRRERSLAVVGLDEPVGDEGRYDRPLIRREEGELLHEELNRLPDKFRVPVILCHFEGLTHEEAAQRLRCPAGTLSARLIRARQILRGRLLRRGVAPALGLATTLAGQDTWAAAPSKALIELTARSATQWTAADLTATGAATAAAAGLARYVVQATDRGRLLGLGAALAAIAVGLVAGAVAIQRLAFRESRNPRVQALAGRVAVNVPGVRQRRTRELALGLPEDPKPADGYFWVDRSPTPFHWPAMRRRDGRAGADPHNFWTDRFRNPANPGDTKHGAAVCYVMEVADGSLLVTILHPAGLQGTTAPDYRPVVFDAQGHRHLPKWEHNAPRASDFGARMPIDHYRLPPNILPARAVASIGVERMARKTRSPVRNLGSSSGQNGLPDPDSADERGKRFQKTPGATWQVAPFWAGDNVWNRFSDANVCCDVIKSRDGSLAIYLAYRRAGGGSFMELLGPALFDASQGRLRPGSSCSERVFSLRDDPNSIEIVSSFHWVSNTCSDEGVARLTRPADEVAFVGVERIARTLPARSATSRIGDAAFDRAVSPKLNRSTSLEKEHPAS